MILTFEEKIMALATIRAVGIRQATIIFSRAKRAPSPTVRETLEKIDSMHYLVGSGVVEITSAGVLLFSEFTCPHQPKSLTEEYFYSCNKQQQNDFNEAFMVLGCSKLCRDVRPQPVNVREPRYAKKEQTS